MDRDEELGGAAWAADATCLGCSGQVVGSCWVLDCEFGMKCQCGAKVAIGLCGLWKGCLNSASASGERQEHFQELKEIRREYN